MSPSIRIPLALAFVVRKIATRWIGASYGLTRGSICAQSAACGEWISMHGATAHQILHSFTQWCKCRNCRATSYIALSAAKSHMAKKPFSPPYQIYHHTSNMYCTRSCNDANAQTAGPFLDYFLALKCDHEYHLVSLLGWNTHTISLWMQQSLTWPKSSSHHLAMW